MLPARETLSLLPASVAHLDAPSDWRPGGRGFNQKRCSFIDSAIDSRVSIMRNVWGT